MRIVVYFLAFACLMAIAFVVFRVFVRRDYQQKGRLTWRSSFLELMVWGLYMSFPYLYNPQIVAGSLLVLGSVVLWPSWQAVGWLMLYGLVGHLMVSTEEEHLLAVHGEAYARYCQRVPRYVGRWWTRKKDAV